MGLPEGVRVIAWGLSLERCEEACDVHRAEHVFDECCLHVVVCSPTMITYGFNNIRDLFGHRVRLNLSKHAPIVRLDKK